MPDPDTTDAPGGPMNAGVVTPESLRALAEADARLSPPYDFAEFTRRRAVRAEAARVRRTRLGSFTAVAASLSVVMLGMALWRQTAEVPRGAVVPATTVASAEESPALVQAGQLATRDALEERIALIDAMLSESRIAGAQDDTLRAMEQGRSTLVDSLQRVAYAHELIGP